MSSGHRASYAMASIIGTVPEITQISEEPLVIALLIDIARLMPRVIHESVQNKDEHHLGPIAFILTSTCDMMNDRHRWPLSIRELTIPIIDVAISELPPASLANIAPGTLTKLSKVISGHATDSHSIIYTAVKLICKLLILDKDNRHLERKILVIRRLGCLASSHDHYKYVPLLNHLCQSADDEEVCLAAADVALTIAGSYKEVEAIPFSDNIVSKLVEKYSENISFISRLSALSIANSQEIISKSLFNHLKNINLSLKQPMIVEFNAMPIDINGKIGFRKKPSITDLPWPDCIDISIILSRFKATMEFYDEFCNNRHQDKLAAMKYLVFLSVSSDRLIISNDLVVEDLIELDDSIYGQERLYLLWLRVFEIVLSNAQLGIEQRGAILCQLLPRLFDPNHSIQQSTVYCLTWLIRERTLKEMIFEFKEIIIDVINMQLRNPVIYSNSPKLLLAFMTLSSPQELLLVVPWKQLLELLEDPSYPWQVYADVLDCLGELLKICQDCPKIQSINDQIVCNTLAVTANFLSFDHEIVRLKTLRVVQRSSEYFEKSGIDFLPSVHLLWERLVSRLFEDDARVVRGACRALTNLTALDPSFVKDRISDLWWKRLSKCSWIEPDCVIAMVIRWFECEVEMSKAMVESIMIVTLKYPLSISGLFRIILSSDYGDILWYHMHYNPLFTNTKALVC